MTDNTRSDGKMEFHRRLEQKLSELVDWTLANSPLDDSSLTREDFIDLQQQFIKLAIQGNVFAREPEPSEGGAQYIQVTPAPWP